MCDVKLSLFDALIKELTDETTIRDTEVLNEEMVSYTSSRNGRKTIMSAARYRAVTSLVPGLQKRFIGSTSDSATLSLADRHANAVNEFLEDNKRCESFNATYDPWKLSSFSQTVRGEIKWLLSDVLDSANGSVLNLQTLAVGLRSGPGASRGVPGDAGSYARLMDSKMSFSSKDVFLAYKACTRLSRLAFSAEAVRSFHYGAQDSFNTVALFQSVPKTNKKNRGICTQPSGNMALQLATHGVLFDVLNHSFSCDLSTQQDCNKQLAYYGSRGCKSFAKQSWEFCTVDLSRASNFPWVLVCDLFPENWVSWLDLIRSPAMEVDGVVVPKHMCSTMGNGFTFSLMTVLLSAVVKVLYSLANLPEFDVDPVTGVQFKTWGVYGDDIIIDKSVFNALLQVLDSFGFLVNKDKTFSTGLFRESCGGDFYDGYPVRPVYLETLDTQADIFSLINRLVQWGALHSVDLPKSIAVLRTALKIEYRVPNWEDVSSGLHVPYSHAPNPTSTLIPRPLREVFGRRPKGGGYYALLCPALKRRRLYREITRAVQFSHLRYTKYRYSDVSWTGELSSYPCTQVTDWNVKNIPGAISCTIEGSLRRGQYGVRTNGPTAYEPEWRFAPRWGDPALCGGTATRISSGTTGAAYRLWEEYVRRVIFVRRGFVAV